MDRTSWIAIILSIAGLFWWNYTYSKRQAERLAEYRKQLAAAQEAAARSGANREAIEASKESAAQSYANLDSDSQGPPVDQEKKTSPTEQTLSIRSPEGSLEYLFTSRGGIASVRLLKHLADKNSEEKHILINPLGSWPIGALFDENDAIQKVFTLKPAQDSSSVVLEGTEGATIIRKVFRLPPVEPTKDPYVTELEITWINRSKETAKIPPKFLSVGELSPIHKNDQPIYTGLDYYRNGGVRHVAVNWFDSQRIPLLGIETRSAQQIYKNTEEQIDWVGVRNQFFASLLTPRDAKASGVWARRLRLLELNDEPLNGRLVYGIEGALRLPDLEIPAGEKITRSFQIYTGPRELSRLQKLKQNEADIMNYGMFKIISEILLHSMNGLKSLTGNYATAILLLTVIIKLLLYPLQNAATLQMKRMSLLSPKMTELREKYKTNPQKMNEEIMKLYKEYGVNPFSGCLPMFIQIPIFFGFFGMLGTAVELRNSGFLWVQDLSQPDTVFRIGSIPINILPIIMAVTMFWQMAITPKTGDKMQQRVFMFMPLIFILFCYNYASALALYWTAQNLFSIVQLYLTRDQPMPELKKVQPAATLSSEKHARRKKGPSGTLPGRPGGRS